MKNLLFVLAFIGLCTFVGSASAHGHGGVGGRFNGHVGGYGYGYNYNRTLFVNGPLYTGSYYNNVVFYQPPLYVSVIPASYYAAPAAPLVVSAPAVVPADPGLVPAVSALPVVPLATIGYLQGLAIADIRTYFLNTYGRFDGNRLFNRHFGVNGISHTATTRAAFNVSITKSTSTANGVTTTTKTITKTPATASKPMTAQSAAKAAARAAARSAHGGRR